jgi:chlorobactene glucosyltransferase
MSVLAWMLAGSCGLTVLLALQLGVNLACFRRPRVAGAGKELPRGGISILVPARNEAGRIGRCVRSLVAQGVEVGEILVLDDRSEDGTVEEARAAAAGDARVRVLSGEPLPEGWTGKAWACAQLARAARGEWLLFTDADTRHAPGAAAAALEEARGVALVSLWPEQELGSWSERLVVPFMLVMLLVFLPHWMPGRRRSLGAANGQFMLFRRAAYEAVGGHGAVRGHLVDDVALARALRGRGEKVRNRNGRGWVVCRMYEDASGVWEGFSKNLRAGFEGSAVSFLALHVVEFVWGLWPFLVLGAMGLAGAVGADPVAAGLAAGQAVLVLGMRVAIASACGQPWSTVLLHPFGQLAVFAIAANSWRVTAAGQVRWKGRSYSGN